MASLIDIVDVHLSTGQQAAGVCRQLGIIRTPREIKVLAYLGKVGGAAAPEIAAATGLDPDTVKGIIRRLLEEPKLLIWYPEGPPPPGRPRDGAAHRGILKLTPQGLRLYDRIKKPLV